VRAGLVGTIIHGECAVAPCESAGASLRGTNVCAVRLLYLFGFVLFTGCFALNAATLAGFDLLNVCLVLWLPIVVLHFVLAGYGFYSPTKSMRIRRPETWKWLLRKLPSFCRYVVWVFWAYSVAGMVALIVYLATHGQVHGDQYYYAFQKSRPATPFEIRREHGWALFFATILWTQPLIFPALYFLFEDDAGAARAGRRSPHNTI
jgi:hypothetical protein